jgi:hypothetical protein
MPRLVLGSACGKLLCRIPCPRCRCYALSAQPTISELHEGISLLWLRCPLRSVRSMKAVQVLPTGWRSFPLPAPALGPG